MSRSSNPVSELSVDSKFKVSYADSGKDAYVSAYGIARIINDPAITATMDENDRSLVSERC